MLCNFTAHEIAKFSAQLHLAYAKEIVNFLKALDTFEENALQVT